MARIGLIRNLTLATLVAVYLVILAGSVVRMTGSGMGCPDWPKCFGQWIPPTDVAELPSSYESDYLILRKKKLDKYISLIDGLGMPEVARQMKEDPNLLETEPFDAVGTWIEYVNRLFGFMSGNFMLALCIVSFWWLKKKPIIPILVFISLIAIGFQAWLGSVVVATNLLPWTITIHMIVAFLIIALLIKVYHIIPQSGEILLIKYRWLLGLALILTLVQVVLGTQVRQEIDQIARAVMDRNSWIGQLSSKFEVHRSFSILLLLVTASFLYLNQSLWKGVLAFKFIGIFLLLEILVGVVLAYAGMPNYAQPSHLIIATLFFGAQCWIFFLPRKAAEA